MRYIMRRAIALLAVCLPITACVAQTPENRHRLTDSGDATEFASELRRNNIPFRLSEDGSIWYPADKEATVDRILKEVLASRSGGVNYPDAVDLESFKTKLTAAQIPFREIDRLGRKWIVWDSRFDSQANAIQIQVDDESADRYRKLRESRK
jgi:hypothetical protein